MNSLALPIAKATLDLCIYIESIVKNFERYHKFGMGHELSSASRALLFRIHKANRRKSSKRVEALLELVEQCEEIKMRIALAKELKVFRSFKQFEHSSKLAVAVCRQAQAWLKSSAGVLHE